MRRVDRPYVGIPSFLRSKVVADAKTLDAMIGVFGVPFDEGSPFLPGSRMGPRAIREHSLRFAGRYGIHDVETGRDYLADEMAQGLIADLGDADIHPTNPERSFEAVTELTRNVIGQGALPVVLGGDHSITFAIVRALRRTAPRAAIRRAYRLRADHAGAPLHQRPRLPAYRGNAPRQRLDADRYSQPQDLARSRWRISAGTAIASSPWVPSGRRSPKRSPRPFQRARAAISASISTRSTCRSCRAASRPSRTA